MHEEDRKRYGYDHCGSFMVTAEIFSHILCAMKRVFFLFCFVFFGEFKAEEWAWGHNLIGMVLNAIKKESTERSRRVAT